jgi:hypothetical protein
MMRSFLVLALLAALPCGAVEGAVSAEITIGKQFALNVNGEISPVQDRLWIVLGYGLLKSPDVPATDTVPKITTSANHLFTLGVDVSPHRSWTFSLNGQFSPMAWESVALNPGSPIPDRITLSTTRRSAGASGSIVFDSAGLSDFEWGADLGCGFTWNELGLVLSRGAFVKLTARDIGDRENLYVVRPQLGLNATIADRVTLSVRGGYTFYEPKDVLNVGRLSADDVPEIATAVAHRLADQIQLFQGVAAAVMERLLAFDALSGYPYAPVLFDFKGAVQVKFVRSFALQLSWTYLRYVPTQGFGNIAALKGSFHLGDNWRAWIIAALQLDATNDYPASKSDWQLTGHLSLGGEFGF